MIVYVFEVRVNTAFYSKVNLSPESWQVVESQLYFRLNFRNPLPYRSRVPGAGWSPEMADYFKYSAHIFFARVCALTIAWPILPPEWGRKYTPGPQRDVRNMLKSKVRVNIL